jgi:hypothetical protein
MTNKLLKNLIIFAIFAMFFITANQALAISGELKASTNDGAQCFINGREIFNNLSSAQTNSYWNKTVSVSGDYFVSGQNVLACRVSNGDGNRGTYTGYFDVELTVDSQLIISRGSSDWRYYGTGGSTYPPYGDSNGRGWSESLYNDSSWQTGSTPFNGQTSNVLRTAPDDAWFRKYFTLSGSFYNNTCSTYSSRSACLAISGCIWTGSYCVDYSSASCSSFNNQTDCLAKSGCSWSGSYCYANAVSNCSSYYDRNSCLARGNCSWTGSYCLESSLTSCSSFNNQTDCLTKSGCYWTGSYCTNSSNINNCAYQNNRTNCLGTSGCIWTGSYCTIISLTGCSNFTTQIDCQNKAGCSWNGSYCSNTQYISNPINNFSLYGCLVPTIRTFDKYKLLPKNTKEVTLESARPLITGLSKYGNKIEIFVDNKSAGEAVVKEGEYSGVANFYFKPKANFVDYSKKLEAHSIKIVATNSRDNSVCTTDPITFIIVPYPAPIIHRLGEIAYVQRADMFSLRTRNPLITGLVKYGSLVEIYVDNKLVGLAKVKEGQKTGIANFYLTIPKLTAGKHTLYALAKKASQPDIESPSSQVYTFTVE